MWQNRLQVGPWPQYYVWGHPLVSWSYWNMPKWPQEATILPMQNVFYNQNYLLICTWIWAWLSVAIFRFNCISNTRLTTVSGKNTFGPRFFSLSTSTCCRTGRPCTPRIPLTINHWNYIVSIHKVRTWRIFKPLCFRPRPL